MNSSSMYPCCNVHFQCTNMCHWHTLTMRSRSISEITNTCHCWGMFSHDMSLELFCVPPANNGPIQICSCEIWHERLCDVTDILRHDIENNIFLMLFRTTFRLSFCYLCLLHEYFQTLPNFSSICRTEHSAIRRHHWKRCQSCIQYTHKVQFFGHWSLIDVLRLHKTVNFHTVIGDAKM